MGKDKSKTRLDKGGGKAAFIGFGAFSAPPSSADDSQLYDRQYGRSPSSLGSLSWTPVYSGSESDVHALFPRISQKKDVITRVKAMRELAFYFDNVDKHKRQQADTLAHWAWLYHHKLTYDAQPAARAAALVVWKAIALRIPKICKTFMEQYPELCGMLFSTQCDPDAQVRTQYNESIESIYSSVEWPWQQGLLEYVDRILSYGRPSVLHQALFARKTEDTATASATALQSLNEQQRDALEESYERIVGTALAAMETWVRQYYVADEGTSSTTTTSLNEPQLIWFQAINGSKPTLRYKAYQLLSTCMMNNLEQLVPTDIAATLAQKVLPSEKKPNNIPLLLETTLVVLSKQPQHATMFQKPLQKILSKACYGARVGSWGPTLLPILSFFGDQQLSLLHALQEGRPLGGADNWELQYVLIECSSFVLLRKTPSGDGGIDDETSNAQQVAMIWLNAVSRALEECVTVLPPLAKNAYNLVLQETAKSLLRFEAASSQRPDCKFYLIRDWFWTSGLTFNSSSDPVAVSELISALREQQQQTLSLCLPAIKAYFLESLRNFQGSSGSVPTDGAYRLWMQSVHYFGSGSILTAAELERFVINDLLRWIIIHTSAWSAQEQDVSLVQYDFELLACCLDAVRETEKKLSLGESVLKEVLATRCRLDLLVEGIKAALKTDGSAEWIRCSPLEQFAEEVGLLGYILSDQERTAEIKKGGTTAETEFLRLCLGLEEYPSIVSSKLVSKLISCGCIPLDDLQLTAGIRSKSRSLMEVLIELLNNRREELSSTEIDRILLTSWYSGGRPFERATVSLFGQDMALCRRLITQASALVCKKLQFTFESANDQTDHSGGHVANWSKLAGRLITTAQRFAQVNNSNDVALMPSLKLIGLADGDLWRQQPVNMLDCTLSVLKQFDAGLDRVNLICASTGDPINFLITVLLQLSEASSNACEGVAVQKGRDRAGLLISEICCAEGATEFTEELFRSMIPVTKKYLKETQKEMTIRCVAVLFQLARLLCDPIDDLMDGDTISPTDVKEGMHLWYIHDRENLMEREKVEVTKVHYDAQAGYYFTINKDSQERQTVTERLRMRPFVGEDTEKRSKRSAARASMLELVTIYFDTGASDAYAGELVNVLCGHIGLGEKRGIGSGHYEIISRLANMEIEARQALQEDDLKAAARLFWTLALCLGFGINVPSCTTLAVRKVLLVDLDPTMRALLKFYDQTTDVGTSSSLDKAVLGWVTTCLAVTADNDLYQGALKLIFQLSCNIHQRGSHDGFAQHDLLITKAIGTVLSIAGAGGHLEDSPYIWQQATECLQSWLYRFAIAWEDGDVEPAWLQQTGFSTILDLVQNGDTTIQKLFVDASTPDLVELLTGALLHKWKRHFAFALIDVIAASAEPIFEDAELDRETSARLEEWTHGFDPEEADEIYDDVEIVSRWIPRRMMREMEHWGEEVYEETADPTTIGRLLSWLCVLRYVDSCSPKDFRFRPAFVSYLSLSGAANAALNMAVLNDESIGDSSSNSVSSFLDVDGLLHDASFFQVSHLSAVVLFKTIEILPSVSRKWWEESCPKVYTSDVQMLVEKHVAPHILKREIDRIRGALASFGSMSVKASIMSREVTATYEQDDFDLSVSILLPSTFPFRSADVDCSKTVGVPPDRLKRWSLQIRMMLNSQGGTLQDALMLWKDNVDKEFDGIEPCPVCYSVLHVKTHKLPALQCKTCQNRFHFDCLTQWFRSSGKSQCVLCQQPWQGTLV
jgi:hypothetical protein